MGSLQSDDTEIPTTVLRHFDLTSTPWHDATAADVHRRRKSFPNGRLFFDRLLDMADIPGPSLYPPESPAAVRRLLKAIHECPADRLKQDCFYYYLLKDCDQSTGTVNGHVVPGMEVDSEEMGAREVAAQGTRAEVFARRRCMPQVWRKFVDGYWALDHGEWDMAIDCLSDPALSEIDFVPEILLTLTNYVSPPSHACRLVNLFLSDTYRLLESPFENDIKLIAMASAASISEAFAWIRNQEDADGRLRMREVVWCWALGAPGVPCGAGQGGVQSKALKELLHLPLQPEESAHLVHFLSHPPKSISPPSLSLLHDLVTLRLIHQGHYAESLQLDKELAGTGGREEDRQRRREMVREFIAILPEAQRRALLVDSELTASRREQDRGLVNGSPDEPRAEDVDMGGSWVEDGFSRNGLPLETSTPVVAPTPLHASNSTSNLSRDIPLPASPAQQQQQKLNNSPFAGPPRFAPSAGSGSPTPQGHRVLSGSPFALPRNAQASTSRTAPIVPKPPRQIINDDDNPVVLPHRTNRTKGRAAQPPTEPDPLITASTAPPSHETDTAAAPTPSKNLRRSTRRVVSNTSQPPAKSPSPPPLPSPPSKHLRQRQKSAAPREPQLIPGSFPSTVPEDEVLDEAPEHAQDDLARSARSESRDGSLAPDSQSESGRMTRSASRAVLDDEDGPAPRPKRAKSVQSSRRMSKVGTGAELETPRRSTRRSTAQPSEGGSPTPSVAASLGGRPQNGRVRRETRAGSQTPRMSTRAKRA